MSTTASRELSDRFGQFFRDYCREEIGHLAQRYPSEQRSLFVDFSDLLTWDHEIAEDWLANPDTVQAAAEDALRQYDLPGDVRVDDAHVRLTNLPAEETFYPGGFSPQSRAGTYTAIEGQLERATETYAIIQEAAFECLRCGTHTYVAQDREYAEPTECRGCEREGPFDVNLDESAMVDGQKLRLIEPPEVAKGGEGTTIDVFLEDDLVEAAEPGDKVVVEGTLHLEQQTQNNSKTVRFAPYLDGQAVTTKESEFEDIDITQSDREQIEAIADPTDGEDIFTQAVDSIAPTIEGHDDIKLAIFLQLVGGVRVELPDGTTKRGDTHVLLIGDPSTGKSVLMDAAEAIAPRSVPASGHGASASGLTAAAVRDDFGDGQWTLKAGALVKAHGGLALIDEFDKIKSDAIQSMHKALSQQRIPVNKAGINATLPSETAVLGAANPAEGRWEPMQPAHDQIDIDPALLSRFGLLFKLVDEPDESRDRKIGETMLRTADAAKRIQLPGGKSVDTSDIDPALDPEFLRKYIAYARTNYVPVFRDQSVRREMVDAYVTLRGSNGYDGDAAVPVTSRKLEDVRRLAEASARARLSDVIEEQDVERAQKLVGESLQEFGVNDDGSLDADTIETGTSKTQKQRFRHIEDLIVELQPDDGGGLNIGTLAAEAEERYGYQRRVIRDDVEKMKRKGEAYAPDGDESVRVFGG